MPPQDTQSRLSAVDEAELAAFADGGLEPGRAIAVEARVATSPRLEEELGRQRRAIAAVQRVEVPAPPALRAQVQQLRAQAPARPLLAVVGAALAILAVAAGAVLAITLPDGLPPGPTMVEASELSQRPATAPPPERDHQHRELLAPAAGVDLAPVAFPYLRGRFAWRATGARTDRLDGRRVTTVFYEKRGRRIGYSIVLGPRIPPPVATTDEIAEGVRLRAFLVNDRVVVTFLRRDLTCIVSGRGVGMEELVALAGWRGNRQVRF